MQYLLVVSLGLVGCGRIGFDPTSVGDAGRDDGGSPAEPADHVSGTRLRAIEAIAPGGAAQLLGWHDMDLDTECRFEVASDGVLRCLPVLGTFTGLHADANCTVPLGTGTVPADDPLCSQVRFLRQDNATIFRAGARFLGPTYAGMPGQCIPFAPGSQALVYTLAEQVPLSTFASATERIVPHDRLSWIVWSAEDGTEQLAPELFDNERTERCRWRELEPNEVRCLPPLGTAQLGYEDAACTLPALSGGDVAAGGPVLTTSPTACSNGTQLFELGAPVSTYYVRSGGFCTSVPTPAVAAGAQIPLSRYERAVLATAGPSQIATAYWSTASGFRSPAGLFDTVHGDRCVPVVETGTVRYICAPKPEPNGAPGAFTDAGCTLFQSAIPACRRAWSASITSSGAAPSTCEGLAWDVFAYDVVATAPRYELTSSGCSLITSTVLLRSATVIDATVLPRLQRVVR